MIKLHNIFTKPLEVMKIWLVPFHFEDYPLCCFRVVMGFFSCKKIVLFHILYDFSWLWANLIKLLGNVKIIKVSLLFNFDDFHVLLFLRYNTLLKWKLFSDFATVGRYTCTYHALMAAQLFIILVFKRNLSFVIAVWISKF